MNNEVDNRQPTIKYQHSDLHGWQVVYGPCQMYWCRARKHSMSLDEARAIVQVLELMGSTWETIADDFRRIKPVVQQGYETLRSKRRTGYYLPAWTQAQFDNEIHFAACDAFEGKRASFAF